MHFNLENGLFIIVQITHCYFKGLYSTFQTFGLSLIFNTFIQQGHIKMIKSDSKDMYNVTKDF